MNPAATLSLGNRCGFNPDEPRTFEPPKNGKKRPPVTGDAARRFWKFLLDPSLFPTLRDARKFICDDWAGGQMRGELREACYLLLSAMLYRMDILTRRVGTPSGYKQFTGVTLKKLAKEAGISLRRAERASRALKKAGIIDVHEVYDQTETGDYIGLAAIRVISKSFFKVLGLYEQLKKESAAKYKDWKEKRYERDQGRSELARTVAMKQMDGQHIQDDRLRRSMDKLGTSLKRSARPPP